MIAIIGSPMARVSTDATDRSLRPLAPASSPAAIIVAKLAAARPASRHQVLCFGLTKQDIKRVPAIRVTPASRELITPLCRSCQSDFSCELTNELAERVLIIDGHIENRQFDVVRWVALPMALEWRTRGFHPGTSTSANKGQPRPRSRTYYRGCPAKM